MSILSALWEARNALTLTNADPWRGMGIVDTTSSGVAVTEQSALRYSAVYACVRVLAETIASLPLITYQRRGSSKERAPDFYLYPLLHDSPNPFMTSFELRETLQGHLALWGNAYCEISVDGRGRVTELWPLRPDRMEKVQIIDGQLQYAYRLPNNQLKVFPGWQIFHLRGLSGDGLVGYSPISIARQGIGLGLATEEFGARFFGNGASLGGALTHPERLSDEAVERMRESWQGRHAGLSNAHRIAIFEEGVQYQQIGVPPEDAQFLQTRKFQRTEIASIFRVPPHMIGDLERATFSNIEHQSLEFVTHTIRPWLVRWEQAIHQRLMSDRERRQYFSEFLVEGLLRGDILSRYQAYAVGRQNGWLSADDVRERENMNPLPNGQGEQYLTPLNMVDADGGDMLRALPDSDAVTVTPLLEQRVIADDKEERAQRSATSRHRLQQAYMSNYADVAARVLRREINDVGAAAKKMLGQRNMADFRQWLNEFYEEHQPFVARNFKPVLDGYAKLVASEVERETEQDTDNEALDRFVDAYLATFATRHAVRSQAAIENAITDTEEPEAELDALWDTWREGRPEQIALDETVRANNGIGKFLYSMAGVTYLRWRTIGKDSCPYCQRLEGRIVGIDQWFISAGEDFAADAPGGPLRPAGNVGHPPAHRGCDCMVVAG